MKKRIPSVVLYILSIMLPALIIFVALAGLHITPFGDNTLIISDGNALYINFLAYVGRAVKGQEGILFSFEKGLGGNMMASWAWFLFNPLFALFSFFDVSAYPVAYTYESVLNLSFCGLTMYLLLKDIYGHKISNLIFSSSYALSGFLVANVFQMNFFTGVFTLPIMVLGLRHILNDQNPIIYIVALAYSLMTNFYFGFMLCVASLLIFVSFYTADYQKLKNRKIVAVKYILSSLIAGALSAVVWLPALLSLRGGRLDQSVAYAVSFSENMPFLEMAAKLFTGANTTAELSNGLPNIFVGVLPLALTILFFMNRTTDHRRKYAACFLLSFYLITFYIRAFNLIMHGGTVTNWFNYRDSFVFSFLLLMIAAQQWQHIDEVPKEDFKRAGIYLLIGVLIVFSKSYEFVTGGAVLLDLLLLALMYFAWRMHSKDPVNNPKHIFEMVILVLVSLNLFLNYYFCTKNIQIWDEKQSDYQKTVVPVSALVDAVKQSDPEFYRIEVGEQHSGNLGNDPMLYGYNGVGHGGSDDRNFVREALNKLGVHRYDMRNSYGRGISAATDTLLGLKYVISKDDLAEEKGYEKLVELEGYSLYRNNDALPIAVLSGAGISDTDTGFENIFENLNGAWSAIADIDLPVFHDETDISFISHNVTDPLELSHNEAAQIVQKRDVNIKQRESESQADREEAVTSEEEITAILDRGEGALKEMPDNISCIQYIWNASRDGAAYSYNRSGVVDNRGAIIPALLSEGYHNTGDIITAYLPMENGLVTKYVLEDVAGRFRAAYVDADALHELATIVKNRSCTVEKVKDSHLRGEFTAEKGQKLVFTIPYDEGWTCYIDGKEVPINQVLDVFMAVDAPEGAHGYEMKFFPVGLKSGIIICCLAIILFITFQIHDQMRIKRMTISGEAKPDAKLESIQDHESSITMIAQVVSRNSGGGFECYTWKDWLAALMVAILILVLGAGLLTTGIPAEFWGDDSAAYINEGIAIANNTFEEQQSVNYFYHPSTLPKEAQNEKLVYAWGYPLLQAIVYKFVGFDWNSIIWYKIPVLLSIALMSGVLVLFFRRRFSLLAAIVLSFLFCVSGNFLDTPNKMYSDEVFLFFSMLALLLMEVFAERVEKGKPLIGIGITAGVILWITYETRLNGFVICLISLLGYIIDMLRKKQPFKNAIWVLLPFTVMGLLILLSEQIWLAPATQNIGDLFEKSPINNFVHYGTLLSIYFSTIFGPRMAFVGYLLIAVSIVGLIVKGFGENLHLTVLTLGTFFVLLNLPYVQSNRYMYHALLFLVMYMAYGFQFLFQRIFYWLAADAEKDSGRSSQHLERMICSAVLVAVLVISAVMPVLRMRENINHWGEKSPYDVYSDEAIEVYRYIQKLPADKIVAFVKPRSLYLNTGHLSFKPGINGHVLRDADYYLYTKFEFTGYTDPDPADMKIKAVVDNEMYTLYELS